MVRRERCSFIIQPARSRQRRCKRDARENSRFCWQHGERAQKRKGERLLQRVMTRGEKIGEGKQSQIFQYKGAVWKMFKNPFNKASIMMNIKFLRENKASGVVPNIIEGNWKLGYIKMKLISGFEPLKNNILQQSLAHRESLLRAIAVARARLRKDTRYLDLANFANIGVRWRNNKAEKVIFYEGGRQERCNTNIYARQYVLEMIRKLRLTRHKSPFLEQVRRNTVRWLGT